MKQRIQSALLLVACTAALACGDAITDITPSATALSGMWTRLDEVPGSSERWNLTVTDTVIAGNGTWTGEACCSGTLQVSGYTSRDSLHLDVTLTTTGGAPRAPFHERFDGVLKTPTLLEGQTSFEGGPVGTVRLTKGTAALSII